MLSEYWNTGILSEYWNTGMLCRKEFWISDYTCTLYPIIIIRWIVTARPMASGSLLARVLKEVWQVNWDTMGICASSRTSDWNTYCHKLLKYLIVRSCFYIRSNQLGRKAEGFTLVNFVLSVWLKYLNLHPREESRIVFKEDEFYVEFNRRNVSLSVGNFT